MSYQLPDPNPRGILFVSYQSSPRVGFYDVFEHFAMNENFPLCPPRKHGQYAETFPDRWELTPLSGVDGVMGSMNVPKLGVVCSQDPFSALPQHFITLRGGEDFFVPSIPTLKYISQKVTMYSCDC